MDHDEKNFHKCNWVWKGKERDNGTEEILREFSKINKRFNTLKENTTNPKQDKCKSNYIHETTKKQKKRISYKHKKKIDAWLLGVQKQKDRRLFNTNYEGKKENRLSLRY